MEQQNMREYMALIRRGRPDAVAEMTGHANFVSGNVYFYQTKGGVLLAADIHGLPHESGPCKAKVFGFHIHEGGKCAGNASDPFADAGGHYNPNGCEHPHHAGDLPPLFENNGNAFMAFMTNRFAVSDVIGRTVIIHGMPDDFKTQPSGDAGMKIACGIIRKSA